MQKSSSIVDIQESGILKGRKGRSAMAETIWKSAIEQPSPGYRQLAGAGPGRAPELKTVVCAGVAIVLGILVGTMLADGSWQGNGLGKRAQTASVSVQSSPNSSSTTNRTSAAVAQIMPVQTKLTASTLPPPSVVVQTPVKPAPQTQLASAVRPASAVHVTSGAVKVSAAHRAVSGHKRRLAHWRRHLARHHALGRHRLHVPQKAAIVDALPPAKLSPKPAARKLSFKPISPVTLSEFTVEGEDKIAVYNPSAGTIDTYEGESFALDKTTSASIGDEVASNVHYRCDQFWNCSLILDGQIVPNAKRTR
jgi:hypothetical protein